MILSNIKLLMSSKLTRIIIYSFVLVSFFYVFYDIYNSYKGWTTSYVVIDYKYLANKVYAPIAYPEFYNGYSAFLFIVTPFAFIFSFFKKDSFENICNIRRNKDKQLLTNALSVSIAHFVLFFILGFIALAAFYLSTTQSLPPYEYSFQRNPLEDSNYFGRQLGLNNHFLFYMLSLIVGAVLFSFVSFSSTIISQFFSNKIKPIVYIISFFIFLMAPSFIFGAEGVVLDMVELSKIYSINGDVYLESCFVYIGIALGFSILFFSFRKIKEYLFLKGAYENEK